MHTLQPSLYILLNYIQRTQASRHKRFPSFPPQPEHWHEKMLSPLAARLLLLATLCVGVQSNGEYETGSEVVLYANKVRPLRAGQVAQAVCGALPHLQRVGAGGPVRQPQRGVRLLQPALLCAH